MALWPLILFGARLRLNLGQLLGERCDASTAARQVLTSTEAAEAPNFGR